MKSQQSFSLQQKYKIILVGDSQVGKTSIFWRFIYSQPLPETTMTTIDFRQKKIALHDKIIKICVWDTAGQEKFRSIVATYFKSCQGVILVFDLSKKQSWENIKNIWYELAFKRVPNALYLLLGNKKDLQKDVSQAQVLQWCKQKGIYYISTCAKTGQNIEAAFFTLSSMVDRTYQNLVNLSSSFSMNISSQGDTTIEEQNTKYQSRSLWKVQNKLNPKEIINEKTMSMNLKEMKMKYNFKEKKGCCQ